MGGKRSQLNLGQKGFTKENANKRISWWGKRRGRQEGGREWRTPKEYQIKQEQDRAVLEEVPTNKLTCPHCKLQKEREKKGGLRPCTSCAAGSLSSEYIFWNLKIYWKCYYTNWTKQNWNSFFLGRSVLLSFVSFLLFQYYRTHVLGRECFVSCKDGEKPSLLALVLLWQTGTKLTREKSVFCLCGCFFDAYYVHVCLLFI